MLPRAEASSRPFDALKLVKVFATLEVAKDYSTSDYIKTQIFSSSGCQEGGGQRKEEDFNAQHICWDGERD